MEVFAGLARFLALCLVQATVVLAAQSPDLAAKSERGKLAMAAGRYDEAAAVYADLARTLPTDAGILMNLGMAQSMAGRPREALKSLERAVKLKPSLHPAWLFLGTAYLEVGDAASAVRPLAKAVATDPSSVKARRMLADAYLTLERFDEADRQLRRLTELDQNDAAAWYGLGHSHEARARLAFDRLRQMSPESPYETFLTAEVLATEEKYDEAVEHYRVAAEKQPTFVPTAWRGSPRFTITSAGRPKPLERGESWRACRRLTACGKKRRATSGPGASRKPSLRCAFARTRSRTTGARVCTTSWRSWHSPS